MALSLVQPQQLYKIRYYWLDILREKNTDMPKSLAVYHLISFDLDILTFYIDHHDLHDACLLKGKHVLLLETEGDGWMEGWVLR